MGKQEDGSTAAVNDYGVGGFPIFSSQGSMVWDQRTQGYLIAATFAGALITVIPSGYLVYQTSPKYIFAFSIFVYSI